MDKRDTINEWQQLTSFYREGQSEGGVYMADTYTVWLSIVSKTESEFCLWASWWPNRKSDMIPR